MTVHFLINAFLGMAIAKSLTLSPLHPNISIYILHTVLYTFLKVLTRRICLAINNLLVVISFIFVTLMRDSGVILYLEKLGTGHS